MSAANPWPFKSLMLAADLAKVDNDFARLPGGPGRPWLVSPKLDGVRCLVWEGVAYSRNAKPLRNKFVQAWAHQLHNIDGELVVGEPVGGNVLGRSMAVTAIEGEPDFTFHLFDCVEGVAEEFEARRQHVVDEHRGEERIVEVPHWALRTPEEMNEYEAQVLSAGYEGIMGRDPLGPYHHGRSSLSARSCWLWKCKRFTDGEGVVIGLEEAEENTNVQVRDELGRAKRSSAKAGKVGKGMVGTIIIRDKKWGEMRLSPGIMTHAERVTHWQHPDTLIGQRVHWRAFGYGLKEKPRFPRFYGLREQGV